MQVYEYTCCARLCARVSAGTSTVHINHRTLRSYGLERRIQGIRCCNVERAYARKFFLPVDEKFFASVFRFPGLCKNRTWYRSRTTRHVSRNKHKLRATRVFGQAETAYRYVMVSWHMSQSSLKEIRAIVVFYLKKMVNRAGALTRSCSRGDLGYANCIRVVYGVTIRRVLSLSGFRFSRVHG